MLSVASVQNLNTYELTGCAPAGVRFDNFIDHNLAVQQSLGRLGVREQLVMRMIVEGFTQREIAEEMDLSLRTVASICARLCGRVPS